MLTIEKTANDVSVSYIDGGGNGVWCFTTHQHSNRKPDSNDVFSDKSLSYIKGEYQLLIGMNNTLYFVPPKISRNKSLKSIAMMKNFLKKNFLKSVNIKPDLVVVVNSTSHIQEIPDCYPSKNEELFYQSIPYNTVETDSPMLKLCSYLRTHSLVNFITAPPCFKIIAPSSGSNSRTAPINGFAKTSLPIASSEIDG